MAPLAAGCHDGRFFIATDFAGGRALSEFRGEPLPWPRALAIVHALCAPYRVAHDNGVVASVVPDAIHVRTDFEVVDDPYRGQLRETARVWMHLFEHAMRRGGLELRGPPMDYFSPEMLMGKQLDGRSDVYSLGALAYELVTGTMPFPDAKGPAGLITAMLKQTPIPPSERVPDVPVALDVVILRCLEKRKDDRFAGVVDLAEAIAQC